MKLDRVIVVCDNAHVNGGSSLVALSSAVALARLGLKVTVFAAVGPIWPELLAERNIGVVLTGQREILSNPNRGQAAIQGMWNLKAARMMAETIETVDPATTVIHVHNWTKALSASVLRMVLKSPVRVIATLHEYFSICPNGCLYNHRKHAICTLEPMGWRCIREDCDSRSYSHKLWRVGRQALQRSAGLMPDGLDHVILVSDFSREILQRHLPRHVRMHVVKNPIAITRSEPVNVAVNREFAFVGRLSVEKGAALFAKAASDANVQSLFVGDGDCRESITSLNRNVQITGWLPHDAVIERLRNACALVFPSLCYETFGLAVHEAAALGIPAIVADSCAAREHVVDGETGLWFKGGDIDDLRWKLSALSDPTTARCMGLAAYQRFWSDPPLMSAHVDALLQVYDAVLSDAARPGRAFDAV